MKKVLIVTSGILPVPAVRGGAAEYLTQLYIDKNEFEKKFYFDVATVRRPEDKRIFSKYQNTRFIKIDETKITFRISRMIRYVLNKMQPFYYFDNAFVHVLLKKLKKNDIQYDLIVVENNPLYVKSLRKLYKNTKIILHLHNDYLNSKTKHNKYIFNNCYRIYTVSNHIRNQVKTINNNSRKVVTIYNGIDVGRFKRKIPAIDRAKMRAQLSIKEEDFVILFTGRLTKEKGILELIQAFKNIVNEYKNAKLLIVGKEIVERKTQSKFDRKLHKIAKDLGDRIIFTGFVGYENIPNIYNAADILVVPSHWGEPLATTVIEGLSSGIKMIVTNDGGIPEEVDGCEVHIIEKADLVNDLTVALIRAINSKNEKMYTNQEVAQRKFSKDRFSTKILSFIEGALQNE